MGVRGSARLGTLVAAALVLAAAVSGCGSDGGSGPAGLGDHDEKKPVKAEESATVKLDGGDRYRIAVRGLRDVVGQHYDSQSRRWTSPHRLASLGDGRRCRYVEAASAGGTVAATLACFGDEAEDDPPTMSVAVISTDLVHWKQHNLHFEAEGVPGVSPNGRRAVWSQSGSVLTWTERGGTFATRKPAGVTRYFGSQDAVGVTDAGRVLIGRVANCDFRIIGPVPGRVQVQRPDSGRFCSALEVDRFWFEGTDVLKGDEESGRVLTVRREGSVWRRVSTLR